MPRESEKKHILVTGGAGFIGNHLCERLLADGHHVICLDNFQSGCHRNISRFMEHDDFLLVQQDITIPVAFEVDEIYNLACPASPIYYQADPVRTSKTILHGAINMLELAKRCNAKVFQASTSEIYGDPSIHPQNEQYWGNVNPIGIRSCYDQGKRFAESLFFDYQRQYGVSIRVARIFNTFGPYMSPEDGRVVPNFIQQAMQNSPITIYGDGKQTRSFCYIDDLINGILLLMNTPDMATSPVNLGNPEECTILELAEKICDMTNSQSKFVFQPFPLDDPRQRKPDISLARQLLGWEPRIRLTKGLKQTVEHFSRLHQ